MNSRYCIRIVGVSRTLLRSLFGLCPPPPAQEEEHHFSASVGGGFTGINGDDSGKLDHGGNVQVGAGYFFNRYFGITGNFMFNGLGVTRAELNRLNQLDGNARVYTFTADPTVRFRLGLGIRAPFSFSAASRRCTALAVAENRALGKLDDCGKHMALRPRADETAYKKQ
jgi:hypothetical protein